MTRTKKKDNDCKKNKTLSGKCHVVNCKTAAQHYSLNTWVINLTKIKTQLHSEGPVYGKREDRTQMQREIPELRVVEGLLSEALLNHPSP